MRLERNFTYTFCCDDAMITQLGIFKCWLCTAHKWESTLTRIRTNYSKRVCIKIKNIGRFYPFTGHESPQGEQSYSSTLFQTSAPEGGKGLASRPGSTLPPGKTRYPLYRRLGGPQGRSGLVRKISPHRDSMPGPSSPQAVAIPTTLPGSKSRIHGK